MIANNLHSEAFDDKTDNRKSEKKQRYERSKHFIEEFYISPHLFWVLILVHWCILP